MDCSFSFDGSSQPLLPPNTCILSHLTQNQQDQKQEQEQTLKKTCTLFMTNAKHTCWNIYMSIHELLHPTAMPLHNNEK